MKADFRILYEVCENLFENIDQPSLKSNLSGLKADLNKYKAEMKSEMKEMKSEIKDTKFCALYTEIALPPCNTRAESDDNIEYIYIYIYIYKCHQGSLREPICLHCGTFN